MTTTGEEFEEILNAELEVDLGKLSQAAQEGVPEKVQFGF